MIGKILATISIFFLLAIAACTTLPRVSSLFPELDIPPEWSSAYETPDKSFDRLPTYEVNGKLIRIKKLPFDVEGPELEMKRRVAVLNQYLARQVDPYLGVSAKDSACKVVKGDDSELVETKSETSISLVLLTSKAYAVDCYGNSTDRLWDQREFLYCKKTKALFEINVFTPLIASRPDAVATVRCH